MVGIGPPTSAQGLLQALFSGFTPDSDQGVIRGSGHQTSTSCMQGMQLNPCTASLV